MAEAEESAKETSNQDPDLLCEIEQLGYLLSLRLAENQMECRADISLTKEEPELPEPAVESDPSEEETAAKLAAEGGESESLPSKVAAAESDVELESITAREDSTPPPPPPFLAPAELIKLLNRYNIKQGIDFEALYNFCAAVEAGVDQQSVLLATGTEPQTGEDGWFELLVKTSGEEADFAEDEQGNVDLRTRHAFTEIETGQKIGILHQPHEGYPGETVHGLPIPAERGLIYSLIAGDGVELKYDGRVAFAEKEGRALLERQVLSVVDQWVISGDVDLQIGNIEFNGFVEIKGDVLDDFHIKATKGIKVGGVVGACRLESDGTVDVGSMAGKETGEIICHGDLSAGYLNQATVHCYGNVLVKSEIRNSTIKSTGSIIVDGTIVGGSCVALEGIEAKVLGATSGLATHLTAGIYFPDADRFNFLRESLKQIDIQIKRLKAAIGPLEKLHDLDEIVEKRLAILTEQWEKLEVEKDEYGAELAASTKQEQASTNPKINAGAALLEGVFIVLGDASEKIKIERKGPLTIIENSKEGGFRFLSMSSLPMAAAALESDILEKEAAAAVQAAADEAAALEESKAESGAGEDG